MQIVCLQAFLNHVEHKIEEHKPDESISPPLKQPKLQDFDNFSPIKEKDVQQMPIQTSQNQLQQSVQTHFSTPSPTAEKLLPQSQNIPQHPSTISMPETKVLKKNNEVQGLYSYIQNSQGQTLQNKKTTELQRISTHTASQASQTVTPPTVQPPIPAGKKLQQLPSQIQNTKQFPPTPQTKPQHQNPQLSKNTHQPLQASVPSLVFDEEAAVNEYRLKVAKFDLEKLGESLPCIIMTEQWPQQKGKWIERVHLINNANPLYFCLESLDLYISKYCYIIYVSRDRIQIHRMAAILQ